MYRVYVGNLDSEVTEAILNDVLRQRSVSSTAVVVKRGYAFVDCSDAVAFDHAIQQLNGIHASFFLSYSGWHTLPSHASAEACLTGWPNAQPQRRECSVARHHQANLMVCVVCSCCVTCPYREVCRAKGRIGNGET